MPSPEIAAVMDEVVTLRRDFHAHPELGFEEHRTAAIVAERLRAIGLTPVTGVGGTGVVALLEGQAGPGPTVLLRADMDALPVTEATGLEFASTVPGKMHACGHDCHTAVLLGAARVLWGRRALLRGRLKLVFQPAEEMVGGAAAMIADGVLEDPPVDRAFGLHVWSGTPTGQIDIAAGPIMAAADHFSLTVRGRGGHAALPELCRDPLPAAAAIITAAQTIVTRQMPADQTVVLSFTQIHGGEAPNVIPEEVVLGGTARAFDLALRDRLRQRLADLAGHIAAAHGVSAELDYHEGAPPTVNDPAMTAIARAACVAVVGAERVKPFKPLPAGEDFGAILARVPGCFFFVGMRDEAAGSVWPHHHPRFTVDEKVLPIAVAAMVEVARRALEAG
jgi:amidohydrolase